MSYGNLISVLVGGFSVLFERKCKMDRLTKKRRETAVERRVGRLGMGAEGGAVALTTTGTRERSW